MATSLLEAPNEVRPTAREITERSSSKTIRMSLDLTPQMKQVIEDLAEQEGLTGAALLRRAVALFKTVKEGQAAGQVPALVSKSGEITRLVGI